MQLRIVEPRAIFTDTGRTREESLAKLRSALDRLPPFAGILREVLATLSIPTEDVSLVKLGALIERDVILSGRALAVANSAAFSRGKTVVSVREAAVRLGVNRLRNVALGLYVNQLWNGI